MTVDDRRALREKEQQQEDLDEKAANLQVMEKG
jgi:hypothetical protein